MVYSAVFRGKKEVEKNKIEKTVSSGIYLSAEKLQKHSSREK